MSDSEPGPDSDSLPPLEVHPATEPHLPDVNSEDAAPFEVAIPGPARLPSEATTIPPEAEIGSAFEQDPLQNAPRWARLFILGTTERFDTQQEQLNGLGASVRELGDALRALEDPREGLVARVQFVVRELYEQMVNRFLEPIAIHEKLLGIHEELIEKNTGRIATLEGEVKSLEAWKREAIRHIEELQTRLRERTEIT